MSGRAPHESAALVGAKQELRAAAWEHASLVLREIRGIGATSNSSRNAFLDALVDFVVHEGLLWREDLDMVQAELLFGEHHYAEIRRESGGHGWASRE